MLLITVAIGTVGVALASAMVLFPTAFRPTPLAPVASTTGSPSETPRPIDSPTTIPSSNPLPGGTTPSEGDCPTAASGSLSDGTITVSVPATWVSVRDSIDWASSCSAVAQRTVTGDWFMMAAVGTVDDSVGASPQEAAEYIWGWNVDNNYLGVSDVTSTLTSARAITVQGTSGWRLTGEVRGGGVPDVAGDVVDVLVLQKADGTRSALLTSYTIGDARGAAETAAIWASLKVAS